MQGSTYSELSRTFFQGTLQNTTRTDWVAKETKKKFSNFLCTPPIVAVHITDNLENYCASVLKIKAAHNSSKKNYAPFLMKFLFYFTYLSNTFI